MSLPVGNVHLEYATCYKASTRCALTTGELSRFNTLCELHQQSGGGEFWRTESGRELTALHAKIAAYMKAHFPGLVARRAEAVGKEMEPFVRKAWEDVTS